MRYITSSHTSKALWKRISFPQGVTSNYAINNKNSICKPKPKAEAKVLAAKKHSEAEKRRRMRINHQYNTLRTILPNLKKMDKVSVLSETVKRVNALKKAVENLEEVNHYRDRGETVFPCEANMLSVEQFDGEGGIVRASLSCEDRPKLISDLTKALRSVKGKVVKTEMVTVGGRTKSVLWIRGLGSGNEGILVLRRALKVVIDRPLFPGIGRKYSLAQ